MKKLMFLLLASGLFFQSCQKDEPVVTFDTEYVVFGVFAGFCVGEECVEIFKIENGVLYEDQKDNYPSFSDPYVGEYVQVDDSKYQMVKDLEDFMPDQLLDETETVFGQPDAADQGGYYFEIKRDGVQYHYRFDTFKDSNPDYLHDFLDVLADYVIKAK